MSLLNIKNTISKKPKIGLVFPRFNITPPFPLFLLIHITLLCNRKCRWCYQLHDDFYSNYLNMEIEAFEKILSSFRNFKPHIHLYGGEPLSHPDFHLFLERCQKYGYKPTLTSNGDYLDKYSDGIMRSTLSQLNVSLNGLIDNNGNFNSDFEKKIKEFVRKNQRQKIVNFNYVIETNSYNYLEDIVLYLNNNYKEGDFKYFIIQHLGFNKKEMSLNFDFKKLADLLTRVKKVNLKFKLLFLPNIKICDLKDYYINNHIFKNKCYVPWLGLNIYPDLTVTPGGGVFGCNFILGNLNHNSMMEIWRGTNLKAFRLRLIKEGLPGICNRCCHKVYY